VERRGGGALAWGQAWACRPASTARPHPKTHAPPVDAGNVVLLGLGYTAVAVIGPVQPLHCAWAGRAVRAMPTARATAATQRMCGGARGCRLVRGSQEKDGGAGKGRRSSCTRATRGPQRTRGAHKKQWCNGPAGDGWADTDMGAGGLRRGAGGMAPQKGAGGRVGRVTSQQGCLMMVAGDGGQGGGGAPRPSTASCTTRQSAACVGHPGDRGPRAGASAGPNRPHLLRAKKS
jgi:hypothetical protein